MNLRTRLGQLRRTIGGRPPPGRLEVVEAIPVGCDMAEGRPPGVYYNVDGRVATVVFAGPEPDPTVLSSLKARLAPWGMAIVAAPSETPRSLNHVVSESEGQPCATKSTRLPEPGCSG